MVGGFCRLFHPACYSLTGVVRHDVLYRFMRSLYDEIEMIKKVEYDVK